MKSNLTSLPSNLPVPENDGACDHLTGMLMPPVSMPDTDENAVALDELTGRWVIYIYPMTGQPGISLPENWDNIPGARGCTPQSCSFRDHNAELGALHVNILGISTQSTEYQLEAKNRLHLPYRLLSDENLLLKHELNLPTFTINVLEFYKRVTLIINNNYIEKVFYPIFPPDQNAADVLQWIKLNPFSRE